MWVLGTPSSEPFPLFQTPDKPAMWASLLEKAADAGGSICCSFSAHIFRILGMSLSHLFILSLCFVLVRFQMNICRSAQRGIWQHTCQAFPLPTCLPCREKTELLPSYCLEGQNPIFPIVFRGRYFFPLLLHQYLSPMPLTNIVPWLFWLCYDLPFFCFSFK